jgi:Tol biopolymer transport system component
MQLTMARTPSLRPILSIVMLALLIVALAATALFIGSQRRPLPPPFGPASNGAVVFEQQGDLLIADALDGSARTLVGGPEADSYPVFSNQGDRLLFLRAAEQGGFQLMSVRPDGSGLTELGSIPSNYGIRWSPDGTRLLVNYNANPQFSASDGSPDLSAFRLGIVNADGSGFRELDLGAPADVGSWRPDGRQIAFRGYLDDGSVAAFVADADGSGVHQLEIQPARPELLDFEGLAWSPDGKHLGYMSDTGRLTGWQINIADIDAAGEVTDVRPLKFDPDSSQEMLPVWSPANAQIAFVLEKGGLRQVAVAPADGSGPARPLGPPTSSGSGLGYTWSPDGKTIVLTLLPQYGDQTFWSVDVASGAETELQSPTVEIPAWQRLAP